MSVTSAGLRNLSLVAVCGQLRKRRGRVQPRSAQKSYETPRPAVPEVSTDTAFESPRSV